MVVTYRKSQIAGSVLLIFAYFIRRCSGIVHEINKDNIDKFLQGKLLTLTFVDSPTCSKCRILFPFFVAASQTFPHDPEIFFTRTKDPSLAKKWGITQFPSMIYHRVGVKNHIPIDADVTVDDIIDEIALIMHSNFGGLTRTYSVKINDKIYDELVTEPYQSVAMLIHDKGDKAEREVIEKLGYAFRKDDAVLFTSLDLTTHRKLRDEKFFSRDVPAVMWFPADEKDVPKRFGGILSHELLTQFVNERTGLHRGLRGELLPEAGRIPAADLVLDENLVILFEGTSDEMKSVLSAIEDLQPDTERQHAEMLEYYLYILENIAVIADSEEETIEDLLEELEKRLLAKEGLSTRQQEAVKRKRNIINHFQQLQKDYNSQRKTRSKEEMQTELAGKVPDKSQKPEHAHQHYEL